MPQQYEYPLQPISKLCGMVDPLHVHSRHRKMQRHHGNFGGSGKIRAANKIGLPRSRLRLYTLSSRRLLCLGQLYLEIERLRPFARYSAGRSAKARTRPSSYGHCGKMPTCWVQHFRKFYVNLGVMFSFWGFEENRIRFHVFDIFRGRFAPTLRTNTISVYSYASGKHRSHE